MLLGGNHVKRSPTPEQLIRRIAEQDCQERVDVLEQAILQHVDTHLRRLGRHPEMGFVAHRSVLPSGISHFTEIGQPHPCLPKHAPRRIISFFSCRLPALQKQ